MTTLNIIMLFVVPALLGFAGVIGVKSYKKVLLKQEDYTGFLTLGLIFSYLCAICGFTLLIIGTIMSVAGVLKPI